MYIYHDYDTHAHTRTHTHMEIDLFLHTTVHFYILNPYNKKQKQKDNVLVIFCQDIIL